MKAIHGVARALQLDESEDEYQRYESNYKIINGWGRLTLKELHEFMRKIRPIEFSDLEMEYLELLADGQQVIFP